MFPHVLCRVEAPRVRRRRLTEQEISQLDEFGETLRALTAGPRIVPEHRRIPALAPGADSDHEPPTGDVVEGHQLLGEGNGMAEVRRRDQWSKADSIRGERSRSEHGDG